MVDNAEEIFLLGQPMRRDAPKSTKTTLFAAAPKLRGGQADGNGPADAERSDVVQDVLLHLLLPNRVVLRRQRLAPGAGAHSSRVQGVAGAVAEKHGSAKRNS